MTNTPRRMRTANTAICVLLTLAITGSVALFWPSSQSPPLGSAGTEVADSQYRSGPLSESVLFVGDSFTTGTGAGPEGGYPCIVARVMGWSCNVDAQGSTGFVNAGVQARDGKTKKLFDRLATDRGQFEVDTLIIDGGRNDLGYAVEPVLAAMREYLNAARSNWPNAKILMVLPSYATPAIYPQYPQLRSGMEKLVKDVGAQLIDPIAQGWYALPVDIRSIVIGDGVHLNPAGQDHVADQLLNALSRLGFKPKLPFEPRQALKLSEGGE